MDFLQQMAEKSRERVEAARRACPAGRLLERARETALPPRLKFSRGGFDLIAEIKLRSPAVGALKPQAEGIGARAAAYAAAGAAAVSVLTEPSRFDGALEHLEDAVRALAPQGVPAMRKDFIVDPYQITEARVAGAGGVLVILRMLPRGELEALLHAARELQLFVLLEAFDERDIELAHELLADPTFTPQAGAARDWLVGVNCRDLATLQIVPKRLAELVPLLPTSAPRVAESGVISAEDARNASRAGYDLALVGSALMQAHDPGALVKAMLNAGSKT